MGGVGPCSAAHAFGDCLTAEVRNRKIGVRAAWLEVRATPNNKSGQLVHRHAESAEKQVRLLCRGTHRHCDAPMAQRGTGLSGKADRPGGRKKGLPRMAAHSLRISALLPSSAWHLSRASRHRPSSTAAAAAAGAASTGAAAWRRGRLPRAPPASGGPRCAPWARCCRSRAPSRRPGGCHRAAKRRR